MCVCVCVCVCVSWWHWLAKAFLCSGFLPGPIRSALEPACCQCVWLLEKETKRLIVSPLSSRAVWLSFINMMHFCAGRNGSAPLWRWQTALKHSSVLIVIVFKKVIYAVVQNAASLAERGWVELLFTAAEQESRVWLQIWGTSCPELLGMRRQNEDGEGEEEWSCRFLKTAQRREKFARRWYSFSCASYFRKDL